jgi:flagellar basal-body rod protein FlgB
MRARRRRIRWEASVGEISETTLLNALRRQMTIATARELAAASNLANANTPGYKTKDVAFADALDRELTGVTPDATAPGHIGQGATAADVMTTTAQDLPERRDGNNVQMDRELMSMTRAASDFAAAQTVLAAKFRLVRYAINEAK